MVFDRVRDAGQGWTVHRELTVVGLQGLPVPQDAVADWGRMCDELSEEDLETETETELALASGILRKRLDTGRWAVQWGQRAVRLLEFTLCNNFRQDWSETTEEYKTAHQ
jgi:hypothetical protein